jgi:DNA-binding transcriptional regulator YbjK
VGARDDGVSDRRNEIVEATLRLIGRRGVDAVTHRAVAAEAGVPLAATTYYFASKAELVREALELVIARSCDLVERRTAVAGDIDCDQLVERLIAFAAAQMDDPQAPLIAQYELMLEAGRRAELRPLAERWSVAYMQGLTSLVRASPLPDPERSAELISAVIEGALLAQLAAPRDDFVECDLRPMLELAVRGLSAGQPAGRGATASR